jgi:hypothetical protein
MTIWTVTLFDGRTAQISADEITTRNDGSLWLLRSVAPPPAKLVPVAVLAGNEWVSCCVCDATIVWHEREHPAPRFA